MKEKLNEEIKIKDLLKTRRERKNYKKFFNELKKARKKDIKLGEQAEKDRAGLLERLGRVEKLIDKKINLRTELDTEIAILSDEKDRYNTLLRGIL